MPKTTTTTKPGQGRPCRECGSTSRHKRGCSKPPRQTSEPARLTAERAPSSVRALRGSSTAELLELRAGIDAEIRQRLATAEAELAAMRQAVGQDVPFMVRSAAP